MSLRQIFYETNREIGPASLPIIFPLIKGEVSVIDSCRDDRLRQKTWREIQGRHADFTRVTPESNMMDKIRILIIY